MACVLCQFDPPTDTAMLGEYTRWFAGEGLADLRAIEGLQELRVFRNYSGGSPLVTAMAFFPDVRSALQLAASDTWRTLAANLARWGCGDLLLTVLEPSPIVPPYQKQ